MIKEAQSLREKDMSEKLEELSNKKYINLETYKKNGDAVQTPVWFVTFEDILYVITRESTGKVKRLANNSNIRLVPCSLNGKPEGEWISGHATLIQGSEAEKAVKLRKKKYGLRALLAGFMTKAKGNLVVYSIKLD